MKNYYLLTLITIISFCFLSFNNLQTEKISVYHKTKFSNGMTGLSGAPGEDNCTNCHQGPVQDGSSINFLTVKDGVTPVTNYIPGHTYNVELTVSSNATDKGFNCSSMNASNVYTGVFSAGIGAQIMGGSATHSTKNDVEWKWSWTAPLTDEGDITFYVATVNGDGTGLSSDVVYLSQHVLGFTSGIKETVKEKFCFEAGYSSSNNSVDMKFNSIISGDLFFNLIDMKGNSVFTYSLGKSLIGVNNEKIILPSQLKSGIYVVNLMIDNNAVSSKIIIQ